MKSSDEMPSFSIRFVLWFAIAPVLLIFACKEKAKIAVTTEYQAVFLDNGQAFFGRLE